jgi:transposase
MIEETPGAVVSQIARRHGLTAQQFFTRGRGSLPPGGDVATAPPRSVPAVVESALPAGAVQRRDRPWR